METDSDYRLWECGNCRRNFATTSIEETEQCPYCSSVVMVADEEKYTLSENDEQAEGSEQ